MLDVAAAARSRGVLRDRRSVLTRTHGTKGTRFLQWIDGLPYLVHEIDVIFAVHVFHVRAFLQADAVFSRDRTTKLAKSLSRRGVVSYGIRNHLGARRF